MLGLAVLDLGTSPAQAQLTVSGSGGAAVDIYRGVYDQFSAFAWTLAASVVGDVSTPVAVNPGLYFWYAGSGPNVSPVVVGGVTQSATAVLTDVRNAIAQGILGLNLGISGGVLQQWTPDDNNVTFPCIILTHENTTPNRETVVVGTADIGYPVRVMICDRVSRFDHSKMPKYDYWRQRIERNFDGQRLAGVRPSLICSIEDDTYSTIELAKFETLVSQFIIRAKTREPIGPGA